MTDDLLKEVTALPYGARFRRLRAAGIEAKVNSELATEIDRWERGDWQSRVFSVQTCAGNANVARLHRLVNDPSRSVAHQALRLLVYQGDDATLLTVLGQLTHARRHRLITRLRVRRRLAAIDAFLDLGVAQGLNRIAELLPYGSVSTVQRHFAEVEEASGLLFWQRLARLHPTFAVGKILERLATDDAPDALLLRRARSVVTYSGRRAPDLTLELIRALSKFMPLSSIQATEVMWRRPSEVAAIVLQSEEKSSFLLTRVAARIRGDILIRILRERPAALPIQTSWFRKLPVETRAEIARRIGRAWRDADGLIAPELLNLLPTNERIAEAERIAALPILSTRPPTLATYAAYLPWARMRAIVDRFLTHPEGEWRAQGWAALLTSLRFHRDQAGEVLALIRKRKFEQDPVRLAIMQRLATLPPSMWREAHRADIAGIIREALDATDLSPATAVHLTAWVQKLIPGDPRWATEQLVLIYRERGNLGGYFLETRINDAHALTLEDSFLDVGGHWARGNRVGWLIWLAMALGARIRICQRLLHLLVDLLGNESGFHDHTILNLARKYFPHAEFEALAQRLIDGHPSWVAMSTIFEFLHRHRQDLLEPHLGTSVFQMKNSKVELVQLLQNSGYHRYTWRQQIALSATLNKIIRLPSGTEVPKDVWTMLRAISFLALLPAVDPARLIELTSDGRPVIADAAVRALGRLDGGQGIVTLVTALSDHRARLAIYALRNSISALPPQLVLDYLQSAPLDKVTVAKEVVRLIGEFGEVAGLDWLLTTARRDLHRDVRIAILRGLWDHLEHPETWQILELAAQSTDGQTLNGVVRIPADRMSNASRSRLTRLLTGLASHPDAVIRLAVLNRFIELPIRDTEGQLVRAALNSLVAASFDERRAAARVLAANATTLDSTVIAATLNAMQLNYRALAEFVSSLATHLSANAALRRRWETPANAILNVLRSDPLTAGLRLELAASVLGVEGFKQELRFLVDGSFPVSAVRQHAAEAIQRLKQTASQAELFDLESRLANSSDMELRYLALLALLAQSDDQDNWTDERRARLIRYRGDLAPLVAIRARYHFDSDPP